VQLALNWHPEPVEGSPPCSSLILILLLAGLLAACQSTPVPTHQAPPRNLSTQPPPTNTVPPHPPTSTQLPLHQVTAIGFEGKPVYDVAINPLTPTTLYATTTDGIFKSTDGGKNWRATNTGLTYLDVCCLAIDPLTPNILYAGTDDHLLKSVDGGITWATLDTGLEDVTIYGLAIDPADPGRLYLGANHGLFVIRQD
jgi:hypothetical protein